jgi:hypothetical protein
MLGGLLKISSNQKVDIEIVSFIPSKPGSEENAKTQLAALVKTGYEIVATASSGDGSRIGDYFNTFVSVILQRISEPD